MLKPYAGGLRSLVQVRRESVRVEFRVAPGDVVAAGDDVADQLVASGDFVEVGEEPTVEVAGPVVERRKAGRPRKADG